MRVIAPALCGLLMLGAAAHAVPPGARDPDWPCQQIKVAELSLAAVWTGPPFDPATIDWQQDQAVTNLVQQTAERRMPLEQAEARIVAFAQAAQDQKQAKLLAVLAGLFAVLDQERNAVIAGLDRFGARQKELAAGIRDDNERLRRLQADPSADPGELNQTVQRVTWEAEVFQDRRQALSYACAVPGEIEQRLFALAHTIQQALQ